MKATGRGQRHGVALVVVVWAASVFVSCSGSPSGGEEVLDGGRDAASVDSTAGDSTTVDSAAPDSTSADSGVGMGETGAPDGGTSDAGIIDSGVEEGLDGGHDATSMESGASDSSAADSTTLDSSTPDSTALDSTTADSGGGALDTGTLDTGTLDTGTPDTGTPDTGTPDTGIVDSGGPAVLKGAVQKGPFVLGSTVSLSAIDAVGSPTGLVFNTQTTTDLGDFSVSLSYRGNVDMQAQGFYYDEVTGALSGAQIVLRALYQVTTGGTQGAYINIVTHLAHDRALALTAGGMALPAAEAQAETELVTALGIGGGFNPGAVGISLNELGGDTDQNAYLFAVSAVLMQAASEQASDGGSVDAVLQQLINTTAADLANTGTIPAGIVTQLRTAEQDLDIDLTMDLFASRLQAVGSTATVADLNRAIDSDGDGYRNSIDTCPLVANPNQALVPNAVCRAKRHTTFLPAPSTNGCPGNYTPMFAPFAGTASPMLITEMNNPGPFGSLLQSDSQGRFGSYAALSLPSLNWSPLPPYEAFDVDQDGKLDLVTQSSIPAATPFSGWLPGNGQGAFGAAVSFDAMAGSQYQAVALGDFNGDTFIDVVRLLYTAIPSFSVKLAVSLGSGGGHFAAPVLSTLTGLPFTNGGSWQAPMFMPADVNGDNKLDIVMVAPFDTRPSGVSNELEATTLIGNGSGQFAPGALVDLLNPSGGDGFASLADFDGDGHLDVVAWNATSGAALSLGNAAGGFGAAVLVVPPTSLLQPASAVAAAADFTRDGKADLVVLLGYPNAHVYVLPGLGTTFGSPQQIRTGAIRPYVNWEAVVPLAAPDLNGDGKPDILAVVDNCRSPSLASTVEGIVLGP